MRTIVACSLLLGLCVSSLGVAQTPAPQQPAQPSYPSAPLPRNRVNAPAEVPSRKADEPRCANLKGLEKAECERRDNTNDDAPAGVTSSMREKQKEEQKNNADTSTAPTSDTAKDKPSTTATSSSDARSKPAEKRTQETEKAKTTADETDTLGKPPA